MPETYGRWDGERWVPVAVPSSRGARSIVLVVLVALAALAAIGNLVYDQLGYSLGNKEWDLQRCTDQAAVTANGHSDVQLNLLKDCLDQAR